METRSATRSTIAIRSSLEDAFFFEQDRTLIERRTDLRRMAESKEILGKVSGITNDAILERLVNLKVRPETLAALALLPLIEVVWADGEVDERERAMVLAHATSQDIAFGTSEYELLERWLAHRTTGLAGIDREDVASSSDVPAGTLQLRPRLQGVAGRAHRAPGMRHAVMGDPTPTMQVPPPRQISIRTCGRFWIDDPKVLTQASPRGPPSV